MPQGLVIISSNPSTGGVCTTAPPANGSIALTCAYAGPTVPGGEHSLEALLQSSASGMIVVGANVSSATTDPTSNNNSSAAAVGAAVQPIPTLNPAMLAPLALLLAGMGVLVMRRI